MFTPPENPLLYVLARETLRELTPPGCKGSVVIYPNYPGGSYPARWQWATLIEVQLFQPVGRFYPWVHLVWLGESLRLESCKWAPPYRGEPERRFYYEFQ